MKYDKTKELFKRVSEKRELLNSLLLRERIGKSDVWQGRNLFNTDSLMIAIHGDQIVRANKAFADVMGYQQDEIEGKHYLTFVQPYDKELAQELYETLRNLEVDHQEQVAVIVRNKRADGSVVVIRWDTLIRSERNVYYLIGKKI